MAYLLQVDFPFEGPLVKKWKKVLGFSKQY